MAAEPTAREIARRVVDEVLAERSMRRPSVRPVAASAADTAATGSDHLRGAVSVASPSIDPAARHAARRLVDEVLSAHGLRIAGRGVEPPAAAETTPPRDDGRASSADTDPHVDPQAAAAARRIVDEVLRGHEQSVAGPPPPPSRRERERHQTAARSEADIRPPAFTVTDVRTDVDPAAAARRIVEQVLVAHEASSDGTDPATPTPVDDDPIPRELFAAASPGTDDGDGPVVDVADPIVVDVTDGPGADGEAARTVARIVADVLAARAVTVQETDAQTLVEHEDAHRTTLIMADGAVADGAVADGAVADGAVADRAVADEVVDVTDEVVDVTEDRSELDEAWSAVVPIPSNAAVTEGTSELDPASWSEAGPARRTGRWLVTTVFGAIALAYLFPLTVRAVRDLVALS